MRVYPMGLLIGKSKRNLRALYGTICTHRKFRADDRDGEPLSGGKVYSYASGTSTPAALYADPELTTALENPVILDASGEALFYYNGSSYKLTLTDKDDVPQWTIDPVSGSAGGGSASAGVGWGKNTIELRPGAGNCASRRRRVSHLGAGAGGDRVGERSHRHQSGAHPCRPGHPGTPRLLGRADQSRRRHGDHGRQSSGPCLTTAAGEWAGDPHRVRRDLRRHRGGVRDGPLGDVSPGDEAGE